MGGRRKLSCHELSLYKYRCHVVRFPEPLGIHSMTVPDYYIKLYYFRHRRSPYLPSQQILDNYPINTASPISLSLHPNIISSSPYPAELTASPYLTFLKCFCCSSTKFGPDRDVWHQPISGLRWQRKVVR